MYKKLFTTGTKAMLAGVICAGTLMSCHKDKPAPPPPVDITDALKQDSLKYLMYQIMQVTYGDGGRSAAKGLPTYYWYSSVPTINPFDSKYAKAADLLTEMKGYAINPATSAPYDHYSFLDTDGTLTNQLMNGVAEQNASANPTKLGFDVGFSIPSGATKATIYVKYADKNSPAGKAGFDRGWEITSVNGTTNFPTDLTQLQTLYNTILTSSNLSLGVVKNDGTKATITLNAATYNINPVLFDTVYTVKKGSQDVKVGYFVMYTFSSVTNDKGEPTFSKTALDQTIAKFKAQGIQHLIVDFRYNGGGATTTAEYLDNAFAPASAAGKLMYTYKYNDKIMQNLAVTKLDAQANFNAATGGMGLQSIFFVVSGATASASELTLNNLKPYMPVQLIGKKTYGKPVGFIDFNITMYDNDHKPVYLADLYAINFETVNSLGNGGYYTGIPVDVEAVDYVNVPWGVTTVDQNLRQAISYITTGQYLTNLPTGRLSAAATSNLKEAAPGLTPVNGFNGMVDFRLSKKVAALR
ncbi:S41 family peptidase [Chitinophaga arvensicola]|uniref:Peptidase family S41 n=1 Tax=Chitinophaga arvensicola TaxID=29529 RepID=A0A1I0S5L9_9BACT|nr:S41 family peptidase [Chitinophaga arvensicola]SEW50421.1 Peptidase family S41 [Chitinophaga arvensicola]